MTMKVNTKNKKIAKPKPLKIPRTVQESIPYTMVYPEANLIETEQGHFVRIYKLTDVNFAVAREIEQQDMLARYMQLLNMFDPSVSFQIVINNHTIDKKSFEAGVMMKLKNDGLDDLREEENRILEEKIAQGRNNLVCEKYLVVSIPAQNAADAKAEYARYDSEIPHAVYQIGQSACYALSSTEMLRVLYDTYNRGHESEFAAKTQLDGNGREKFDFQNMLRLGLTTKDVIGPDSMTFKPRYFMLGETYGRVEYLSQIPSLLDTAFYPELTSQGFSAMYSLQMSGIPQEKAMKMLKMRFNNVNSNVRQEQMKAAKEGWSGDLISIDLKQKLEEANRQLGDLSSRNQKLFSMTMTIVHFADSLEELDHQTDIIKSVANRYMVSISSMNFQQEAGFNTTLPLCNCQASIKRSLTTEACAVFVPWNAQELNTAGGMYYGTNAITSNLITYDRSLSKNANGFILGTPGSGKSFMAKAEILQVLLNTDDDILILDPEREFFPIAAAINRRSKNGKICRVEHIVQGNKNYINPLDIPLYDLEEEDPMANQLSYVISLCQQMYGRYQLPQGSESLIDRALHQIYAPLLATRAAGRQDESLTPTLVDLMKALQSYGREEPVAREIALSMETFCTGSQDLFAHQTVKRPDEGTVRMTIYDTKDVAQSMKSLAMLIVTNQLWSRLCQNRLRGRRTWIYLDEIYILFNDANSAEFIKQLFKRARKYGGTPTGLTQNVEDLLTNDTVRTMLSNSEFLVLLSQAPIDRSSLETMLNLSSTQLSYISNADPGCGLLKAEKCMIPFKNLYPKNGELYRMMNTNLREMTAEDLKLLDEERNEV